MVLAAVGVPSSERITDLGNSLIFKASAVYEPEHHITIQELGSSTELGTLLQKYGPAYADKLFAY